MELTASQKETIRYQFDSFCRKILREECRDYFRHMNWRNRHEVSFLDLSDEQTILLQTVDEYAVEKTWFQAQEYAIGIHDDQLAEALAALSVEKRDVILLAYFLGMTDQEIADKLNAVRSTVQYRRSCSLKEMKKRLGVMDDGENKE